MMNLNFQQPQQRELSLEEKLMQLISSGLPMAGAAIGTGLGGPAGGALGGILGNLGGMGMNAMMPQQQMQMPEQQPISFGGNNPQGMVNLDAMQQMPQQQQGSGMEQFGAGLGSSLGNAGIQGLMSLLSGGQPTPYQSLMGKMDSTLQEKLARILAMKSMMGRQ